MMRNFTKSCLLVVSVLFYHAAFSQEWAKSIKSENPAFQEIQKAFNDYYKDYENSEDAEMKGKEDGSYEQFKRWEWYWEQRVGKKGVFPPSDILVTETEKYNASHPNQSAQKNANSANWSFYGPSSSTGGYRGIGRINCIAFHPANANTFWVGTPAGGLWKTTDGGINWTTNTGNLPVLGISDIAIVSSNPNTMYIATGDGEAALSLQNGAGDTKSIGVLKSTDGGATWNTTGLNWSVTSQKLIRRLLINPNNSNILLAATSDGIYRTTNGGTSWTNQQPGWFIDMEFKPTDPNYVYASTYDQGGNAQIYTSNNGGVSWFQVTGFFGYNRISLAVTANWDVEVDALCSNSSDNGLGGLWYSTNNGASFSQYFYGTCSNNLLNNSYNASACGGQGNYDLAYALNPANSNEIWLGGVNTWRSTDGGSTFYLRNIWNVSQTNTVQEVHADKHFIAFHPLNNNFVYECNDGGLYFTSNGGTTWTDITNGMGISQIYRLSVTSSAANNVICGLQDNGSKELYGGTWYEATGGDGMECIIDPVNSNTEYASYSSGVIFKTTNGWGSQTTIVNSGGSGVDETGDWVTPYVMDPTNNNTLLIGKTQVYKSVNGGNTWTQLGNITGASGYLIAIAYAPSNTQTIYAATRNEFYRSTNGGNNWSLVATSTDAITYITVSPTNPQKIWVTNSGYTAGGKVYASTDGGNNWSNFSGTLPNIPVNCITYQNGLNDALYIGTDLGVYYRDASMSDWVAYNTGLPNVVVNDIAISYNNNKLWAATFGRGLWRSDLNAVTATNDIGANNFFKIYPNPANDILNIRGWVTSGEPVKITVTNMLGQPLIDKELDSKNGAVESEIDIHELSAGIYFLNLRADDFKHVFKIQKL